MKKLLYCTLFFASSIFAEELPLGKPEGPPNVEVVKIPIMCADTKFVFKELTEQYQEQPMMFGIANDNAKSIFSIWINNETKTFTLIATKDKMSCVIGTGVNFKVKTLPIEKYD